MSIVNCPTGLAVEIRGLKTKEADLLTDTKKIKHNVFDRLLPACTVAVLNPGPYQPAEGKPFDWLAASVADRTLVTVQIRIDTYGKDFELDVACEACRKKIEWTVDLSELPHQPLSADTIAAFAAGNRVEKVLPDGKKAWVRALLTGQDVNNITAMAEKSTDHLFTQLLNARILEVEGVPALDKYRYVSELPLGAVRDMQAQFDDQDGGIDNLITIECQHCMTQQETRLPFDLTFFLPRKKRQPTR
jgi:hypothetical protein